MVLWRYKSDIDKETEKLRSFAETEYSQVLERWKTGELLKLRREKAVKAGIELSLEIGDAKIVDAQEMVEIEHAMMDFRKRQKSRHLCTVSTEQLGRDALIIDAFQLWDALVVRSLISEYEVSEEEVKGVFLVWKKVPKEAVMSCEPMVEKMKFESGKSVQEGTDRVVRTIKEDLQCSGDEGVRAAPSPKLSRPKSSCTKGSTHRLLPIITKKRITSKSGGNLGNTRRAKKSPPQVTEEVATEDSIATTKRKRKVLKVTTEGSPIKRVRRTLEDNTLSPTTSSSANPMNTPSSTRHDSLRNTPAQSTSANPTPSKPTTPASSPKKKRKTMQPQEDAFAVDDVLDHGWGFWKKKGGLYVRDRKGTRFREYLVKWAGEGYEDTWEPEPNLGAECLQHYWKEHGPEPQVPPVGYDFR